MSVLNQREQPGTLQVQKGIKGTARNKYAARTEIKAAANTSYRKYCFLIKYACLGDTFTLLAIITLESSKI